MAPMNPAVPRNLLSSDFLIRTGNSPNIRKGELHIFYTIRHTIKWGQPPDTTEDNPYFIRLTPEMGTRKYANAKCDRIRKSEVNDIDQ